MGTAAEWNIFLLLAFISESKKQVPGCSFAENTLFKVISA